MTVRPAKTQISLGIHPVWSESSLYAHWVAKDPMVLQADSEDSDQTGRMPRLIWVFAGCLVILLVLSRGCSNDVYTLLESIQKKQEEGWKAPETRIKFVITSAYGRKQAHVMKCRLSVFSNRIDTKSVCILLCLNFHKEPGNTGMIPIAYTGLRNR